MDVPSLRSPDWALANRRAARQQHHCVLDPELEGAPMLSAGDHELADAPALTCFWWVRPKHWA